MFKKLLAIGIFNLIMAIVFFAGLFSGVIWWGNQQLKRTQVATVPTGYEVLQSLNAYREKNNLPDFVLDDDLCNNIAERLQNYQNTNSHDGLEEFVAKWHPGRRVSEILVQGETADLQVQRWTGSPSHDLAIRENSKICVYSSEGLSVALLSN